jgi:hypothetical protein
LPAGPVNKSLKPSPRRRREGLLVGGDAELLPFVFKFEDEAVVWGGEDGFLFEVGVEVEGLAGVGAHFGCGGGAEGL